MSAQSLHEIIRNMDFHHVLQPIINTSTNKVYGYEALLRSRHYRNPEIFFKHAREQNVLFELDMMSIYKACKMNLAELGDIYLFLNIYPSTLNHPAFINSLEEITRETKVKANTIVFEINEAERGTDFSALKQVLNQLKQQGFLIAFDDIGKGEATLSTVQTIIPNFAKFDRYYADKLFTSIRKQNHIKKVIHLLDGTMEIVLEGLETEEDLLTAKLLGVPYVQGFYLGKPQPLEFYK
ncbi:EAL domain-containing protein [Virgibacillus halodenitrificans]|uniref:EAL domain-containing protein n=1 Tax=Virgibacillus halodenitrificans TaxID=1482 RepID=A0AAC9NLZ6_VIRHA|nr:EAL domain-containing protein [Virgibacillus halodenitrificans]APC49179.1 hypothetical protein BME96_13660 [Virgibacillus halodenitrificans]MBD1224566.1 EAL domain-containing protein [Virgibacillus halodenitrificans]MCG1026801.1 EAL domain-containing protein [Virgibacillus halodenitrificans]MEC2160576.1 EAL domain-containing protein [Virgibacillus halodenitrificans]MYL56931.1 EAL domain-containing protein [Virgibacillus halodenitrificans]